MQALRAVSVPLIAPPITVTVSISASVSGAFVAATAFSVGFTLTLSSMVAAPLFSFAVVPFA